MMSNMFDKISDLSYYRIRKGKIRGKSEGNSKLGKVKSEKKQERILEMKKNLKLKAARAELDLSQEELAHRAGVSRQTINMIERGDYNPTLNLCLSICHALGKTLDEIFWEE